MTSTIVALAVFALLLWLLVRGHRSGRRPFRLAQFRPGVPFHGVQDPDRDRILADLRAHPDFQPEVETRLRI
jgi:hypothetical protein